MRTSLQNMIEEFGVSDEVRDFLGQTQQMYIDGRFLDGASGTSIDVFEPATAEKLTAIPAGCAEDVDLAVAAARKALKSAPWATMRPNERQAILLKLADLVEEHAQIMAEIETLDNGKALGPCIEIDILGGADLVRYMAGFATKVEGVTRDVSAPGLNMFMTQREPVGVVAAIVPWNWPFNMACWKIAAPLAVGCTIVLKPSELTSLTMLYFMRLCEEAGLPAGVLNIVTGIGSEIGDHLTGHTGVDKVSFTGSTPVGRHVGGVAGQALTPVTLELGGKSPMIVFDDADFDAVAEATRWSVFFNTGQVCSAGSRLYAHRSVIDQVTEKVVAVAKAMKVRPGLDPDCDLGPAISKTALLRIKDYIESGREEGTIVWGGDEPTDMGDGHFINATVIRVDNNDARVVQEEIFGPVLVVVPFDSEEEALRLANDNQYGLAASIWTKDINRALRMVPQVEAGTVWVNAHDVVDSAMPFGGVKNSGFGKDMGPEQLQLYLKSKSVWIAIDTEEKSGS